MPSPNEEKEGAFAQGIEKIYQQLMTVFDEIGCEGNGRGRKGI